MIGPRIVVLAGGHGGAKLAAGMAALIGERLTVVTNTGDDLELWGLTISPDTDSVMYRLAGLIDRVQGWGVAGDTGATIEALRGFGIDPWFHLGDRDMATHLLRTELVRGGATLTDATRSLTRGLGIDATVLPMCDEPVRTIVSTPEGELEFQDYFVRRRCQPVVTGLRLAGASDARPTAAVRSALGDADLVIIGPSNPVASIEPILTVLDGLADPMRTLVVSPVIGQRAIKGPTVAMMRSLGMDPSATGVARHYAGRASTFILDEADGPQRDAVEAAGYRVLMTDTLMPNAAAEQRLAGFILDQMFPQTASVPSVQGR